MSRKNLWCIRILICFGCMVAFHTNFSAAMQNVYRVSKQTMRNLSPSISAVLVECPRRSPPTCDRKMMVNVRVSPSEETEKVQKYLVLDEAYDQKRQTKAKLMSPYLIEITRGEPVLMYPLQFSKSLRCDSCEERKECPAIREEAALRPDQPQLLLHPSKLTGDGTANKVDIRMGSDENPQEVKDHLTDGNFMNLRDSLAKAEIHQKPEPVESGAKSEKLRGEGGAMEEKDSIANNDSPLSENGNKNGGNLLGGNVPPFLAKIHIGMSHNDKKTYAEDDKNQEFLEELASNEQNLKKDVLRSLSMHHGMEKKHSGHGRYQQPKRCGNCQCKGESCQSECTGSGPCNKGCSKCAGTKLSRITYNRQEENERPQDQKYNQQSGRDDDDEDDDSEEEDDAAEGEMRSDKKLMRKDDLTIQEIGDDSSNSYDSRDSLDDISPNEVSEISNARSDNDNADMDGDDWADDSSQSGGSPARYRATDFHKYSQFSDADSRNQRNLANGAEGNYRRENNFDGRVTWSEAGRHRAQGCDNCQSKGQGKFAQIGRTKIAYKRKDSGNGLYGDNRSPLSRTYFPYAESERKNNFPIQRSAPELNEKSFMHSSQYHTGDVPRDAGNGFPFSGGTATQLCPGKNCPLPQMPFREKNGYKTLQSAVNYHPDSDVRPLSASAIGTGSQYAPAGGDELIDGTHSKYGRGEEGDTFLGHHDSSALDIAGNEPNNWGLGGGIYAPSENNFEGSSQNKLHPDGTNGYLDDGAKSEESGAADDHAMGDLNGDELLLASDRKLHNEINKITNYGQSGDLSLPGLYGNKYNVKDSFPNLFKHPFETAGLRDSGAGIIHQSLDGNLIHKTSRDTNFPDNGGYFGILPSSEYKFGQEKVTGVDNDIMDDPNLDTKDKIDLMDSMLEPINSNADQRYTNLEPEVENGFIPYDLSNTDRYPIILQSGQARLNRKFNKRSYSLYKTSNRRNVPEQVMECRDCDDCRMCNCGGGKKSDACKNGSCRRDTCCGGKQAGRCKTGDCKRALHFGKKPGPCKTGNCGRICREPENPEIKRKHRSVSDVWYTVFNTSVPLPFLTTKVRIFRKKENSWWKIAPSITLTSLSGVYANANLSILFSSHVEMYTLDKPLVIKNHRLMLPKDKCDNRKGKDILAVDNSRYNLDKIDADDVRATKSVCDAAFHRLNPDFDEQETNYRTKREDKGVYAVQDFGYFPTQMNVLEKCPNGSKNLCLNILDSEVPAFSIKIQFPFRDNAIVPHDYYQVRITNIFNDATTAGAMLVTITVVNEALISHTFTVLITNCKITCGGNNKVERMLAPHIGEKFTFLLPLQENSPNVKFTCDVQVKSETGKIVATRQMTLEPLKRCLCVWHCACHCIEDTASADDYQACKILPGGKERAAGFVGKKKYNFHWRSALKIVLFLLLLLLLLGLIKAVLGCCIPKVNRWKYDFIQPMNRYDYVTRCYRFFINSLFFLVLPFVCCCNCFSPAPGDEPPSPADSEYGMTFVQKPKNYDYRSDDEETILSQRIEKEDTDRRRGGAGEIEVSAADYFCELYNDDDEDQDTGYVLNALAESRESVKLMDGHYSEELSSADPRGELAAQFVRELIAAKIVYRTLYEPVGNASVPPSQSYSIRGYFLPAAGPGYQFITHIPLRQHWSICPDINTLRPIIPPIMLFSKEFTRSYAGRMDVLEAGDLSVRPSVNAPCINVLVQDISMYHQPDPDDLNEEP